MPNLESQILALQEQTRALEPSASLRHEWQLAADKIIGQFVDKLVDHPTYQPLSPNFLTDFDQAINAASNMDQLLTTIESSMSGTGILTAGPGHMAFVPGGGLYVGAVADHVAASINAFSADAFASPAAVHIHEQTISWLTQMVGYNAKAWGDITSGGSHATLTAFYVARQTAGIVASDYEKTCVYLSEHTHHCVRKALNILFGDAICIRQVPLHDSVMDVAELREQILRDQALGLKPWLVVATAGSTNLGRVDPLQGLADLAKDFGLWLHVDAAYGGFFNLCDEVQGLFVGLSAADSIVLDPHKGMFLPYGCGAVLFKLGDLLRRSLDHTGDYLQDRDETQQKSPMDFSLELTRPFRSLRIWLALKIHGETIFKQALQEKLLLAAYCRDQLAQIDQLTMVGGMDLSIFAFYWRGDAATSNILTKQLLAAINARKDVFLSSTVVEGRFVIRVAILSFRTHLQTVERLVEIIRAEVAMMMRQASV